MRQEGLVPSLWKRFSGCYIEIQTKAKPHWTKYGLTNYHVVRHCLNGYTMNLEGQGNSTKHVMAPPSKRSEL